MSPMARIRMRGFDSRKLAVPESSIIIPGTRSVSKHCFVRGLRIPDKSPPHQPDRRNVPVGATTREVVLYKSRLSDHNSLSLVSTIQFAQRNAQTHLPG